MIIRQAKVWVLFGALGALVLAGCGGNGALGPEANASDAMKIREKLVNTKVAANAPGGETGGEEKAESAAKKFDGWATLKGRFVVEGAPPAESPIHPSKDQEVCGAQLANESVVVGTDKGLANVVLFVRTTKIPINDEYKKTAADKIPLDNKGCRFVPHVLGIRVGQTLQIKNSDPVGHNTKISGSSLQFNNSIPVGTTLDLAIDAAEAQPAPVACSIHDWMNGRILIRPDPYFAISDKDGNFEIKDLPAGELEFQAWQESIGGLPLNQPDLKWDSKGRFTIALHNGEVKDLKDISVPASLFQGH
jgi:plastocyanin